MSQAEANIATEGPYYSLTVSEVVRETHDSCSVSLAIPAGLEQTFAYRAGQFLTFRMTVAGQRLVRCYSLASSPVTDPVHKVTVKRVDDGRVSNHVNEEIAVGATLEVMKPAGVFCLQEESDLPLVMFSGGSGITPVISIVKTALATTARPIRLLYANRDERSIIFQGELQALVEANRTRLVVEHSLDEVHGFVDLARARAFAAETPGADFYICGPGAFMDIVEGALAELGTPATQIFIERFESLSDESPGESTSPGSEGSTTVSVVLDGKTTEISCGPDETILQAARRAGLEPPFACEEAYCGCCMARLKSGEVEMKMNDGGIDDTQIEQGWILTCQGVPKSPECTVEYPD